MSSVDIEPYLNIIRTATSGESVRDAIIDCMRQINADSMLISKNLLITSSANRTYKAGTGYAFKNVTVNIDGEGQSDPSKTYTFEEFNVTDATENGTYEPEHADAYSRVVVDKSKTGVSNIAEEAEMTYLDTDPVTGRKFWDACMADSGYDAVKRIWIGVNTGLPDYPGGAGTGGNGPFVVTFVNENGAKIYQVADIPYGASVYSADSQLDQHLAGKYASTTAKGVFQYWSGNINNVTSNFTSSPQYGPVSAGGSIGDSWDKIMEDGGAHYAIGSTAILDTVTTDLTEVSIVGYEDGADQPGVPVVYTYPAKHVMAGKLSGGVEMMVVAHGEGGTRTTWLATQPVGTAFEEIYDWGAEVSKNCLWGDGVRGGQYGSTDAVGSINYQFLDKILFNLLPEAVKNAIQVCPTKRQYGFNSGAYVISDIRQNINGYVNVTSRPAGRIWLPSYAEIAGLASDAIANQRTTVLARSDKTFTPEEGAGALDYSGSGWKPKYWNSSPESGNHVDSIATRSTFLCQTGPRMFVDVNAYTLQISDREAATIQEGISVSASSLSHGYERRTYFFGFCT